MFLHRISRYDSQEIPGTNNKSHFLQITSILYSCYFEMSIKSIIARLQFYLNDTFVYVVRQKRAIAWSSSNPYKNYKISTHNVYRIFPDSTPVSCRACPYSNQHRIQQILTLRLYSVAKTSPTVLHRNSPRALSLIHNVGD